jgi:hypothetical protein
MENEIVVSENHNLETWDSSDPRWQMFIEGTMKPITCKEYLLRFKGIDLSGKKAQERTEEEQAAIKEGRNEYALQVSAAKKFRRQLVAALVANEESAIINVRFGKATEDPITGKKTYDRNHATVTITQDPTTGNANKLSAQLAASEDEKRQLLRRNQELEAKLKLVSSGINGTELADAMNN